MEDRAWHDTGRHGQLEFLETLDQAHPGLIPRPATPQTHQGLEPRIG